MCFFFMCASFTEQQLKAANKGGNNSSTDKKRTNMFLVAKRFYTTHNACHYENSTSETGEIVLTKAFFRPA